MSIKGKFICQCLFFEIEIGIEGRGLKVIIMRRDEAFIHVYVAGDDTIVHIRQLIFIGDNQEIASESQNGVVLNLTQFQSLMFHLRALDTQFTQGSENISLEIAHDNKEYETNYKNNDGGCEDFYHHNTLNMEIGVVEENENEKVECEMLAMNPSLGEMCQITTSIPSEHIVKDNTLTSKPATLLKNNDVTYIPKLAMTQADVRDELAVIFAEEVTYILPDIVRDTCVGCKTGINRNESPEKHDVCMLTRKKRIELFCEMALLLTDEKVIQKKILNRLKNRKATFKESWIYENRHSLLSSKKWLARVKKYSLKM